MRVAALVLVGLAGLGCRRGALQMDAGGTGTIPGLDAAIAGDGGGAALDAPSGVDGGLPTPDQNCGVKSFSKLHLVPEILVVLDRSIAIDSTRWNAFLSSVTTTITANNDNVDWGLYAFPPNGPACESISTEITVLPAPDSAMHVIEHMIAAGTGASGTPTATAIDIASAYMRSRSTTNAKYLLLVTDATPNCPDPAQGQADALASITEANQMGLPTLVLAPSTTTIDVRALNDLAQAGGYPQRGDVQFFTEKTIGDVLQPLPGGTCTFSLAPTPPPVPELVTVTFNGVPIPRSPSHTAGWDYASSNDTTFIGLYGLFCDMWIANSPGVLSVYYGCP